ncbi:WAPL superfamily domain-containing protein [Histoplasma capsulatum G186AR]|uniref:WAPL superfamily domain-containing protein n=1 Tax=Ajellomyces capsulatus TaxID=5037 RepID=A0A8H7YG27_AJECA|nr:WAPL superfamily domain-containing protein [Histoplasma capsulatum]QSS72399.1 WAPL superfamily domain-containing protein [Histoplasma capsulatum G186AR]
MAPAAKSATPHRQLITYGKSSVGPKYDIGPKSSPALTRTQVPEPSPEEPPNQVSTAQTTVGGVRKTTKDGQGHRGAGTLQTPRLPKPSRSSLLHHRTPNYRGRKQWVYDIASSGDEQLHEDNEPWRKRRKIESPKAEWASNGFEDAAMPNPKRSTKRDIRHDSSDSDTITFKKSSVPPGESNQIEVVILTPKKPTGRHHGYSTKEGTMECANALDANLPRRAKDSTTTNPQTHRSSRKTSDSLSRQQTQRPLKPLTTKLLRAGKSEQASTPKTFPLNSRYKPAASHPVAAEVGGNKTECNVIMSTTPSRRRIVDALGTTARGRSESSTIESISVASRASSEISTGLSEDSTPSISQLPNVSHRMQIDSQADSPDQRQQSQSQGTTGPKATYARQRSFLSAKSITEDLILDNLFRPSFAQQHGPGHGTGPGVSNHVASKSTCPLATRITGDDDEGNSNRVVRNIYELRRAGENARFEGIVDAIFEDIEDPNSSASRRYSGLIQLCTKLMDDQFTRRFLAHVLEKRLAKQAGNLDDAIYTYLIACAYGLILSAGPVSSVVLRTCSTQVFRVIPKMITDKSEILDISKFGPARTSKAVQGSLRDFCEQLAESRIWHDVKPKKCIPQILALRCIEMVVRRSRESGDNMDYMSNDVLSQLVNLLLQRSVLPKQVQDAKTDDFLILELTFSILESYTVVLNSLEPSQEKLLKRLSGLGPLLFQLSSRCSQPCYRQIQLLEIRLILNLTNNNPSLCEDFSTPELIQALMAIVMSNFGLVSEDFAGDRRDSLLDVVILALGTLINLTEWNETARQLILKTPSGSTTFLNRLLQLFKDGWDKTSEADSVVQTHSNVAFGYLSVLLSTVSLDDEARLHLRNSLDGRSVDRVLATVDEFLHYHRKVEKELQDGQGEHEPVTGFTCRLQSIVDRIKQAEGIC